MQIWVGSSGYLADPRLPTLQSLLSIPGKQAHGSDRIEAGDQVVDILIGLSPAHPSVHAMFRKLEVLGFLKWEAAVPPWNS